MYHTLRDRTLHTLECEQTSYALERPLYALQRIPGGKVYFIREKFIYDKLVDLNYVYTDLLRLKSEHTLVFFLKWFENTSFKTDENGLRDLKTRIDGCNETVLSYKISLWPYPRDIVPGTELYAYYDKISKTLLALETCNDLTKYDLVCVAKWDSRINTELLFDSIESVKEYLQILVKTTDVSEKVQEYIETHYLVSKDKHYSIRATDLLANVNQNINQQISFKQLNKILESKLEKVRKSDGIYYYGLRKRIGMHESTPEEGPRPYQVDSFCLLKETNDNADVL